MYLLFVRASSHFHVAGHTASYSYMRDHIYKIHVLKYSNKKESSLKHTNFKQFKETVWLDPSRTLHEQKLLLQLPLLGRGHSTKQELLGRPDRI